MTNGSEAEGLFAAARELVKRGCLERFKKDQAQLANAAEVFHKLPLLTKPEIKELSLAALSQAKGRRIDGNEPFRSTIWVGGAEHTGTVKGQSKGIRFDRSLFDFVKLLTERSIVVAPKGSGWVIEPTTNRDGERTNASTLSIHALFLDCDGIGTWDDLVRELIRLGFCFVAYQSGGWTPTKPKWRIVLPLHDTFVTTTDELRDAWKMAYLNARVVFGSIANLSGEGFDPATDTPASPWFLTEKRNENDVRRDVIWSQGHTLDLVSLLFHLPAIEEETRPTRENRPVVENGLSDEKLDEIIKALSDVTNNVPNGRHDLYLALPGVMLDRGVPADEVLAIIEEVSASYPRKHADKHKDNIHNAKTTISKWQNGGNVTRIGTLNERWPTIAQALDRVLPDPVSAAFEASTAALLTSNSLLNTPTATPAAPTAKKRLRLSALGKEILPVAKQMTDSTNPKRRRGGALILHILNGQSFDAPGTTTEQVDQLVSEAMQALGFALPTTTWGEVLDLANKTLLSMNFTQSLERVAAAEKSFLSGQRARQKWNRKKQSKVDESRERTRNFLASSTRKP